MALLLDRHPIGEEVLEFLHQFVSFSERDATLKLPLDVRVVVERIFRVDEHVGRPTSRAASTLTWPPFRNPTRFLSPGQSSTYESRHCVPRSCCACHAQGVSRAGENTRVGRGVDA